MSGQIGFPRVAHAAGSLATVTLLFYILVSLFAGGVFHFNAQLNTLADRRDSVKTLAAKLEEERADTRRQLAAIGAASHDLATLASPDGAKSLISEACANLAKTIDATCSVTEQPLTSTLSLHQARLAATAPFAKIATSLAEVKTPLRLANLTFRSSGADGAVEATALIEVAGARSAEEPAS